MLATTNLCFRYQDSPVLTGLNLDFSAQAVTGLVGANGCGKSTLFMNLSGILRPQQGAVLWQGKPLEYSKRGLLALRQQVTTVFQDPDQQIFYTDIDSDIAFALRNLGVDEAEIARRVEDALTLVDAQHFRHQPIQCLSHGQKKRVAIAGALVLKARYLLLDEPTAGLDPKERARFRNILSTLSKNRIVILSTHIVSDIESNANQVILLKERKLYRMDTVSNICKTLDGKVYECVMEDRAFDAFQDTHLILSVRQEQEHMQVRYYSSKPEEGSRNCTPNLEDVFLVTYQEEPA